jgi:hypothetical protein
LCRIPRKRSSQAQSSKLRDEQSGAERDTVTNADGYYTFVSVPPGGYELSVSAPGFESYKQANQFINPNYLIREDGPATLPVVYGPAYFNADLGLSKTLR